MRPNTVNGHLPAFDGWARDVDLNLGDLTERIPVLFGSHQLGPSSERMKGAIPHNCSLADQEEERYDYHTQF